jgi:hypothetical protein
MLVAHRNRLPLSPCAALASLALTATLLLPSTVLAQATNNTNNTNNNNNNNNNNNTGGGTNINFSNRAVGGVFVDTQGVLRYLAPDREGMLGALRAQQLREITGDLTAFNELRKISLAGLDAAIAEHLRTGNTLPDEIRYLGGLQRVQYVFVYPEFNDIILAGPAEGWRVDRRGNVVGVTTGRPVMHLDDLLVALRTAEQAASGGISCSIDPTPEGLTRLQNFVRRNLSQTQATVRGMEQSLGAQTISVTGVPADTHFAQVLVAADYRMKRLAMGFEKAPIEGLPSFMSLAGAGKKGLSNMMPRWWMAPNYEPVLKDAEGLAYELRGQGVKTLTEEDVLNADGSKQRTGKSSSEAQKWANLMTTRYEDLALADPIFGELRNVMDLAVVGALIVKENLAARASVSLPVLLNATTLPTVEYPAPRAVDSQASVLRKGSNWVVSVSGGVEINSWAVADRTEQSAALRPIYDQTVTAKPSGWWWN